MSSPLGRGWKGKGRKAGTEKDPWQTRAKILIPKYVSFQIYHIHMIIHLLVYISFTNYIGQIFKRKLGWEHSTCGCLATVPVSFLFSRFSFCCMARTVTAISVDPGTPSVCSQISVQVFASSSYWDNLETWTKWSEYEDSCLYFLDLE